MAGSIDRLLFVKLLEKDRSCDIGLASIMVDRWNDPYFNLADRIALRHKAAAHLDAAEVSGAKAIMNDAEDELLDMSAMSTLWRSRIRALGVYPESAKRDSYLEEVGGKMLAERLIVGTPVANGLLTYMAKKIAAISLSNFSAMVQKVAINLLLGLNH